MQVKQKSCTKNCFTLPHNEKGCIGIPEEQILFVNAWSQWDYG